MIIDVAKRVLVLLSLLLAAMALATPLAGPLSPRTRTSACSATRTRT